MHPKVVSERLGHASIAITLDTYSHVMPGMQEEAAEKIDAGLRAALAGWAYPEGRYATVTTTCPFLCPFSTYVWASTISSSG